MHQPTKNITAFSAALAIAAFTAPAATLAQEAAWPTRPIKIIVTFVPGGGADILGRYIAQGLTSALGQPVVVENKAGAGGLIGVDAGLAAPADGYTLTLISSSYTVNPSLYKLKFDPVHDITPIAQISAGPLLVVTHPSSDLKTMKDIERAARKAPGTVTYASSGKGSALHLAAAEFANRTRVEMNHIPYKGGGAALNDVLGKQVDVYFAATASALPHVAGGKLRAVAVTTPKRLSALPDVPTIQESGYPGYDVTLWYGLIGPKGMPTAVVQRINQEINKILALPATPKKFQTHGAEPAGGTPEAFRQLIGQEIKTWGDIVGKLDIKPH